MADSNADLDAFRAEARTWLEDNFPASLKDKGLAPWGARQEGVHVDDDARAWQASLGAKGWGTPTWPAEYGGGGLTNQQARVLQEEMARIGASNPIPAVAIMGVTMVGPTILDYGTKEQKQRHIPPICRGEIAWCIGYSEPNSGSDLASLSTRAEDKGDYWLINGQKVWTSGANAADWCGALVRTDTSKPKREGISFMMVSMKQSGVTTRPIQLISGSSPFCETFFNDARAEKNDLLGPLNEGWSVGKRLLQHERASQTGGRGSGSGPAPKPIHEIAKTYVGTDEQGRLADLDLRGRIVEQVMAAAAHTLTTRRIAAEAKGNVQVSAAQSIMKNSATIVGQLHAELMIEIMGNQGLGWEGEGFSKSEIDATRAWLGGKAQSIYGGSYEIQNNIISKNILGLPETTQKG